MNIIDGRRTAAAIRRQLKQHVARLSGTPGLAIVLVGTDPASRTYVSLKEKAAREIGVHFEKYVFPATTPEKAVLKCIKELNARQDIHGIVVQFPLPRGLSKQTVIRTIAPEKDVDGFKPENITALLAGKPFVVPGLAAGIMQLLEGTGVRLAGMHAVVLANSKVFSVPLAYLLKQRGVAVTAFKPTAQALQRKAPTGDILIVAVGSPNLVTGKMVKPGALVVDVGYNRVQGRAIGDVDFASVKDVAGRITPVPGGVGPMTVAMLLKNVVSAYEHHK
ncbi:MAG: bifunctional 5,10-methylenetetrahydrofolate dehydrogenase/5,10-methenyltetrahydrofolate cyclohydrolase [Patescibacteria group bacterium]|nr:bifunctional 5,10-methylenetetrahydrofolate dehydrogenase/5,10-methenyltetrahydrofolate cyclohydrolase [Patescibacteria group bacterium]MDD5715824.1 bifunctional 5,10-methylenetetrahydrofolate dehydrogenase/5,10-methenyltetrahydrofolate cyclohydrolase [Patescibacteria group bacterium]